MRLCNERKKLKTIILVLFVFVASMGMSAKAGGEGSYIPVISGKMVFHSYTSYESDDSKLYLFDFDSCEKECLSDKFKNVYNAMNANFNNDGSEIVFMGMEKSSEERKWDIYIYNLETDELRNLTKDNDLRNEDPKFSPDGKRVIFKQGHWDEEKDDMVYDLRELNLDNNKIKIITQDADEDSMPFYSSDGKEVYYAKGINAATKIYKVSVDNYKNTRNVYSSNGEMSYYPIVYKDALYFTKWYSKSNDTDIIMKMDINTKIVRKIKFDNKDYNTSDPCPISDKYIIMSSTKGDKGYDLYLGDTESGAMWSLDNINSEINDYKEQLGASCYIKSIE